MLILVSHRKRNFSLSKQHLAPLNFPFLSEVVTDSSIGSIKSICLSHDNYTKPCGTCASPVIAISVQGNCRTTRGHFFYRHIFPRFVISRLCSHLVVRGAALIDTDIGVRVHFSVIIKTNLLSCLKGNSTRIGVPNSNSAAFPGIQTFPSCIRQYLMVSSKTKPSSTVRPVELEHSSRSPVFADCILHGLVLLHRGLGQLLTELQHTAERLLGRFQ